MTTSAIVLAAGEGTRMRSARPKPLHLLCGRPMLDYVISALDEIKCDQTVVVVGHGADRVTARMQADRGSRLDFVVQSVQRGTGDAVRVGLTAFEDDPEDDDHIIVMPGDAPLLRPSTVAKLVEAHIDNNAAATLLTAISDPTGYGRILRDKHGNVKRVVEEKDATDEERAIREWNTGFYVFRRNLLGPALRRLTTDNSQGEYYLTDVAEVLSTAGHRVGTFVVEDPVEPVGVNDRLQLAIAEAALRARVNAQWLKAGVTMLDPSQVFIDTTVSLGRDVTLFPGTLLQGNTVIGNGCEIGPDTRLIDCEVGDNAVIENSVCRGSVIGEGATVGPYGALSAGTTIPSGFATGPFYAPGAGA
jgi:bifunctional UDP-N-acetylglucosamine pyrophosphorylase / glucosamine-1-phosphate N-acetyltransferase